MHFLKVVFGLGLMLIAYLTVFRLITTVPVGTNFFALAVPMSFVVMLQAWGTIILVTSVMEQRDKNDYNP